jgi:MSHA pilin protein MshD
MFIHKTAYSVRQYREAGLSLIELIMFIVIVSVGVAGVLSVMNVTAKTSADPMITKQALAIAESLMEEIQLQPFTYCDPDDPNAAIAATVNDCTGGAAGSNNQSKLPLGQQAIDTGETRYSTSKAFDNVSDYAGFSMSGIKSIADGTTTIHGLGGYNASVAIAEEAVGGVPANASLRIDVRVWSDSGADVTLTGYRLRYAPNTTP